jgi:uncharacterized protein YggE
VAARVTAERMAAATGRGVGAALHITDAVESPPGWAPRQTMLERSAMAAPADAPPLEPAAQELQAAATVTFELTG